MADRGKGAAINRKRWRIKERGIRGRKRREQSAGRNLELDGRTYREK